MWNRKSLLRACEALLEREDCTIRLRTIQEHQTTAHCDYVVGEEGAEKPRLTIDPAKGGLVECALHEALHAVLQEIIGSNFNSTLDEVIIRALERDIWTHMKRNETNKWRRILNAKLG